MKIISVKFTSSQQFIEGVGASRSQIKIGDACDNAWGGGKIVSLEHDVLTGSLHIRKGARYVRTLAEESNNKPTFDVAMVPWGNVACACGVEDAVSISKPEDAPAHGPAAEPTAKQEQDPPPAQPIQKQSNQGQQRR